MGNVHQDDPEVFVRLGILAVHIDGVAAIEVLPAIAENSLDGLEWQVIDGREVGVVDFIATESDHPEYLYPKGEVLFNIFIDGGMVTIEDVLAELP